MLLKHLIALSLAAVAASQKLDDCVVTIRFTVGDKFSVAKAIDCVFQELPHNDCYHRYNSLRAAFTAPSETDARTCSYDIVSSVHLSVTDFLNIPAVCSMLDGKAAYAKSSECISSE
ncbi:hypothetical protein BG005_006240 [Podila minutissima]|nr:hypothetical protein BG005_006240 [Podila minutissima]